MKALAVTGVTGLVSAVAAVGGPALTLFAVLLLVAAGIGCWVITNRARTMNTVALITAARSRPASIEGVAGEPVTADVRALPGGVDPPAGDTPETREEGPGTTTAGDP